MRKGDLDGYTAAFRHLARRAGYDINAKGTMRLYALGLQNHILDPILDKDTQPTNLEEWVAAARNEVKKQQNKLAFRRKEPQFHRYDKPQQSRPRRHPNDVPVPMDVDPPSFYINKAYTEADKNKWRTEGRCFRCDRQGHMARECPLRKQQPYKPQYQKRYPQKPEFKPKPFFKPQERHQGFRKKNPFTRPAYVKAAYIEEMEPEEDQYEEKEEEVSSLAARTARLSEPEKEIWLAEMKEVGINF
jgi:hypothetical protein